MFTCFLVLFSILLPKLLFAFKGAVVELLSIMLQKEASSRLLSCFFHMEVCVHCCDLGLDVRIKTMIYFTLLQSLIVQLILSVGNFSKCTSNE